MRGSGTMSTRSYRSILKAESGTQMSSSPWSARACAADGLVAASVAASDAGGGEASRGARRRAAAPVDRRLGLYGVS